MPDSFDYTTGTNSENVRLLQALIDDAPEYTEETNSRNANILKSIINNTEYTDAPQSEIEELLLRLKAKIGGEIEVDELTVTENGTYDAGVNKAYNPVNVELPLSSKTITENGTYTASDDNLAGFNEVTVAVEGYAKKSISNTPTPIATFNASALPMPSLTVGIEAVQSGSGDPSPTNIRPISGWSAVNVTRASENLFNGEYPYIDNTVRKITLDVGDGSFTMVSTIPVYVNAGQNIANIFLQTGTGDVTASSDLDGVWAGHPITVNSTDGKVTIKYRIFNNIGVCDPRRYDTWLARSITTYTTTLKDGQGNPMTCYGGKLDNQNGVQTLDNEWLYLTIDRVDVLNTAETSSRKYFSKTIGALGDVVNGEIICDSYITTIINTSTTTVGINIINSSTYNDARINIRPSNIGSYTLNSFNAELAENPIHVIYKVTNPQQIPQDSLAISSSAGVNNIWADSGDIQSGEYMEAL